MAYFGRKVIYSDATEITSENVLSEVRNAYNTFRSIRGEIRYLYNYYKGKQPVLTRDKKIRPEICNKIVENRANEIVSFKVGYLCGEPIQYVCRKSDADSLKGITDLNEYMYEENKASKDKEVVEWQMICGTAYRLALPNTNSIDGTPFHIFTLNPIDTMVVYSKELGNRVLMGVMMRTDKNNNVTFYVYSDRMYWKIYGDKVVEAKPHALGVVPIFEYPANNARLGAFEIVLPLLDAINTVASNRIDAVEQFVQSFVKFINCDIDEKGFEALKDMGAIRVKSMEGQKADVDIVTSELNQMQTQTLVDSMYQTVLTICGMPNRNGGSSTSDTGTAVIMRDGWSLAESRAKDSELMFKMSENEMLKLILRICRDSQNASDEVAKLRISDIAMQFTRRNYEAIQSKAQVLCEMLGQGKIHPKLAFEHCGMFTDPEEAYRMSDEYSRENGVDTVVQGSTLNNADGRQA